jgi:hypothetical protein
LQQELSKEAFVEQIDTEFRVLENEEPVLSLKLIEVTGPGVQGVQERFDLLFRGPLQTPLGQGIQRVEHERFGVMDLFLVPISREADGFTYEAVFNRLLS